MERNPEACRIVLLYKGGVPGEMIVDVAAPLKHKALCYDILASARSVILKSRPEAFASPDGYTGTRIVIVMDMHGTVDVGAPLPNNPEFCLDMLRAAHSVIERYDDEAAPEARPFAGALLGDRRG